MAGRKRTNPPPPANLKPEDFVFSTNVGRLCNAAYADRSVLGRFVSVEHLAVDMETGDVVDGDDDLGQLIKRLEQAHGKQYYYRITLVLNNFPAPATSQT